MHKDGHDLEGVAGPHWSKFSKKQKIALFLSLAGAVLLIFLTGLSVENGINAPFRGSIKELIKNKDMLKDPATEKTALDKRTDSDGDGLSDWAEENIYHTSPYLWSTAGDNVPDNVKIALGENPLCKQGQACTVASQMNFNLATSSELGAALQTINSGNSVNSALMGNTASGQNFLQQAQQAGLNTDEASQISRDPVVLRKAIMETGKVTQAELDKVSDTQLLQMLDQTETEMKQQQASSTSSSDSATTSTTP